MNKNNPWIEEKISLPKEIIKKLSGKEKAKKKYIILFKTIQEVKGKCQWFIFCSGIEDVIRHLQKLNEKQLESLIGVKEVKEDEKISLGAKLVIK
jgi:hypothetical protein